MGFGKSHAETAADSHDLAGGFHLGTEKRVHPRESRKRKDRFLDGHVGGENLFCQAQLLEAHAHHDFGGQSCKGDPCGLAHKRNRPRSSWIDLEDINEAVLDGILNVHQPDDAEFSGQGFGFFRDPFQDLGGQRNGRQDAGAVAAVNACFLDVLHNPCHDRLPAVAQGVHVDFNGMAEEPIDEHGFSGRHFHGVMDVAFQVALIMHNLHGPAAQNKGGPDQNRIPDPGGNGNGFLPVHCNSVFRLTESELVQKLLKPFPVFGPVDAVRSGAQNPHPRLGQGDGKVERGLAPELNDHAFRLFLLDNAQHIFSCKGLEVELVRRVVVRAHGLGIAVDHDALNPHFLEGKGGLHAAVVELDALSDPIGPPSKDKHFPFL